MIGCMRVIFGGMLLLAAFTSFAGSPIHYIENKSQWPSDFRFGAEFPNMKVMLKDASIFFVQHSYIPDDHKSKRKLRSGKIKESHVHAPGERRVSTFELTFLDALQPTISWSGKQKTIYNYFFGNDPSTWVSAAGAYEEVRYKEIYKGIDLSVYSQGGAMKYDWIVTPCANVNSIRFSYKGIESIDLRNEELVIESKLGEVVETKPYAYQIVNGVKRGVRTAFEIDDDIVNFVFPDGYDSNYELVIDPALIFSSYSGSTLDNWGNTATPDSHGNLYSGGMVDGTGIDAGLSFPTTAGAYQVTHGGGTWDLGIIKYDSTGANVLYTTYLGGTGNETPQSLVVNSNDELLILGATSSTDFPGTSGGFKGGTDVDPIGGVPYFGGTDLFIAKLNADGSQLIKSAYVGGSSNDGINFISGGLLGSHVESPLARNYGDALRGDILSDNDGNVYIATNTMSSDFPVINTDPTAAFHGGSHDGVVVKLNADLVPVWTRLIGGNNTDAAYSIKIAGSGEIIVAGGTLSNNLAGMNGAITTAPGNTDGWIVKLSPAGDQIVDATYIGTPSYDQAYFIDIATNDDILVYGQTQGSYPVSAGVYAIRNSGQFLHRFKSDLRTTVFSTTFGRGQQSPDISPTAFLVNACDRIYMAGWGGRINTAAYWGNTTNFIGGTTTGLPVTSDAWQSKTLGNDFYMMVLTGDGKELVYATFLGGTNSLTHVDGGTSRFDKRGIVYHAVCAGCGGQPSDFPSYHVPASRSINRSDNCNNAAFKFDLSSLRAVLQTNNVELTKPGLNLVCLKDTIVFQNLGIGGERFIWTFGDGTTLNVTNQNNIKHLYKKEGVYNVQLKAIDLSTCVGIDSVSTTVTVHKPVMAAGPNQDICFGTSTRLTATGGVNYVWKTLTGQPYNEESPLVAPQDSTSYYVTMTDSYGCVLKDTLRVNVVPRIEAKFEYDKIFDCQGPPVVKVVNLTEMKEGETAIILFGDGTSSDEAEATHKYEVDGEYIITLRTMKDFCVYEAEQSVKVVTVKVPNVITPAKEDGLNDFFKIIYGNDPLLKDAAVINLRVVNRWGNLVFEKKDYKDDWKGGDLESGVYYYEVDMDETTCKGWINLIK